MLRSIMAGQLEREGPSLQPMSLGIEELRRELNDPAKYPPFLALQLVFRDYMQGAPPTFFSSCRLVSKQFKAAVEAAHPPYTWHINGERLKKELETVIRFITSEPRWEWVTKVRLSGAGVSMTQKSWDLLVGALGARAWESIALVEVKLTDPLMLPAITKTSAERGTLRQLSIADSPVSSAGLQSALSALSHCLWTLELSPGIPFVAPSERPLVAAKSSSKSVGGLFLGDTNETPKVAEDCACQSVRTLNLGDAHEASELGGRDQPALRAKLPVTMFRLKALRTLWLVGLEGLTEDDVIGIFRRTPLLEEFRLFKSGSRVYSDDSPGIRVTGGGGPIAPLTPAAVAGVFKGLTRHLCPSLARISIGWKHYPIGNQDLHGSWLRRFADAHPGMTEVKLFLTGAFSSEDWLYALAMWAPMHGHPGEGHRALWSTLRRLGRGAGVGAARKGPPVDGARVPRGMLPGRYSVDTVSVAGCVREAEVRGG
eukprot:TRINITY_DN4719_c0_g1_i1.p1 TRINITY_DN4719_c0_g1~~TRINITY_DN4719_c0_g1_i1.p1  ORF type:complete len:484 (-),score=30.48 TRINITY_DN4719_c0_g1_i1:564-2015(-)